MTTGGRGITPERARQAAEAGLDSASVSIDGVEETHDRLRGVKGSHRAAFEALTNLRAAGVRVSCNTQINRLSLPDLPELLESIARAGVHSWQIQLTVPMGRAADEPEVLFQPYDMLELFPLLGKLKARCDELGVRLWPGNNIGYFGPYEQIIRSRPDSPETHYQGCLAGIFSMGIESNGTVKGCPTLPTEAYAGGNVRDMSLEDLWEKSDVIRFARDRTTDELWGFCKTCYYADVCRAGCSWTVHTTLGRRGNNPFCYYRVTELKKRGIREKLVHKARAPNLPYDHGLFELVEEPWPDEAV